MKTVFRAMVEKNSGMSTCEIGMHNLNELNAESKITQYRRNRFDSSRKA